MSEPDNTASKANGNDRKPESQSTDREQSQDNQADQSLAFRIKEAIDQRGKYSFRMNDMAAGYAAGRQISQPVARRLIESNFQAQFGQTPREYLQEQFEERDRAGVSKAFDRNR